MELNERAVLNIFSRNFLFEQVETPMGLGVKIPARDAFVFSAVTGAGYLSNPILPFSPKGLLKLFYNAFDYNFVTGIFENASLKHTPFNLSLAKTYLFDSEYKFVVPIEFDTELELQETLKARFKALNRSTDYIILRIEKSKSGNGMESFMEYLAAEYFRKQGYIVENQIPLAHSIGSPDFGGYSVVEIVENVRQFVGSGFHIIELAMIRLNGASLGPGEVHDARDNSNIVGEAKTSTRMMTTQLIKYLNTGLFDFGFEIHPEKRRPARGDFGLLSLNDQGELFFEKPEHEYQGSQTHSTVDYTAWLTNYMKFYLIANLTNDELTAFYGEETGKISPGQKEIANFVCQLPTDRIIAQLQEVINGGV
jgi:hypothetical protein